MNIKILKIQYVCLIYQGKANAHTGRQHPNISTTFIGKSKPLEEECELTPKSAQASKRVKKSYELRVDWDTFCNVYILTIQRRIVEHELLVYSYVAFC